MPRLRRSRSASLAGGSAALAFTATASSTGNWLVVSPASGTTPGTVNVSINTAGLSTGTYTGTVLVAGSGGAPGSTSVNVTLNVTAPLPTITKVTNAASYATGAIAPGEIITLFAGDPDPSDRTGNPGWSDARYQRQGRHDHRRSAGAHQRVCLPDDLRQRVAGFRRGALRTEAVHHRHDLDQVPRPDIQLRFGECDHHFAGTVYGQRFGDRSGSDRQLQRLHQLPV